VVGCIKKIARAYFNIEIEMEQLQLQDESEGVPHTSWRVTTVNPEETYKLRGKRVRRVREDGDDVTLSTSATTTASRYERTFREGGTQASRLRVEEFVKRSYHNPICELYHALTLEQFLYLCDYWKENKSNGLWCYETWPIQDDDPSTWVTLDELPEKLNPATINDIHFGGKTPKTGAFPPDENGVPQSFPPKIRVLNDITGMSKDIVVPKDPGLTLEEAIFNHPEVEEGKLKEFPPEWQARLNANELEIRCSVWDDEPDDAFHNFTVDDLATTSTKQLFELVPRSFDPIKIYLVCEETANVDEDEEDL
jgi:hypothetical protein